MRWRAQSPITSPIAIFEAALGICRKRHASVEEAEQDVVEFLALTESGQCLVTDPDAHTALAAFSRYGKGRGPSRSKAKILTRPTPAPPRDRAEIGVGGWRRAVRRRRTGRAVGGTNMVRVAG
jgi:hypothetical protein